MINGAKKFGNANLRQKAAKMLRGHFWQIVLQKHSVICDCPIERS